MMKEDIYAARGGSVAQRVVVTAAAGAALAIAWWLLGWRFSAGNAARRWCLAAALLIYFVRLLFTQFVFMRRAMGWGEAAMIAPWVVCIYIFFAIVGGKSQAEFGVAGVVGAAFFIFGSWMNSYAEYAREVWKRRPENRERLYTLGLFRYSRHPNYLGDLILFTGLGLICGRWISAAVPAIMLCGFVFANIPLLDSHLHDHYGAAFDEYARRTRKLIPFVY